MRRLRWILFAEQLRGDATLDVDGLRRQFDEELWTLDHPDPRAQKTRRRTQLTVARRDVTRIAKERDATRALLWPPDESEEQTDG